MRALLTVNNKKKIVEFAKKLEELNVELVSAGATYEVLKSSGVSVTDVSTMIYHNNSLNCIIKTLYTEVFAAIDADRKDMNHMHQLQSTGIKPFDIVVINIHDFAEDIHDDTDTTLKYIDVGGVTLLKSASKNYKKIIIVCHPEDYDLVASELKDNGDVSLETRKYLMKKAFNTFCDYDNEIRDYINRVI